MPTDFSAMSVFLQNVMNDNFARVSMLTFFLCEAVFSMLPIEKARSKQAASLFLGGILGLLTINGAPLDAFTQGLLAGGATTMLVAKFKKPSSAVVGSSDSGTQNVPSTVTTSETMHEEPMATDVIIPSEEIAEHL